MQTARLGADHASSAHINLSHHLQYNCSMSHRHEQTRPTTGGLRTAFGLNLAFTVLEIVVGLLTNSVAILSDAVHDLSDSLSLGLSWILERYAGREGDDRFSYGYRRFSLLGALLSTVVLIVGSLFVLAEAIPRLLDPEPTNAAGMAVFALVGIAANGAAILRLRGQRTLNARVVAWHLLEDVLGWVAVFIVGLVLLFRPFYILDAILSLMITTYVLVNVVRNLRRTASLFLQAVPEEVQLEKFEKALRNIPKVQSTHHTHVWSLDGQHHVLTAHIVVDDDTQPAELVDIKCDIRDLTQDMSLEHTTFEVEFESEECGMRAREPSPPPLESPGSWPAPQQPT